MAHTNQWSTTTPADNELAGNGAEEIRQTKLDIIERLGSDHCTSGELDTTKSGADGYHNKVTLSIRSSDPTLLANSGVLYAKSDGLYFRNSAGIVKII